MKPATDEALVAAAKAIAHRHGMFVSFKNGEYRVFRRAQPKPIFVGKRHSPSDLFDLVDDLATVK